MKTFKIIILIYILPHLSYGQDTIYISHNKTTAIQFPTSIENPVVAGKYLDAKISDSNLLTLRAADKEFKSTNLEIKAINGQSFNFPIAFSYGRAGRFNKFQLAGHGEIYNRKSISSLFNISERIASERKFHTIDRDKSGKVNSRLASVVISDNTLFYKLDIRNESNINYDIDFIRFYVRDLKIAKRTVTQEQEIYAVYSYGLEDKTIEGQQSGQYVFAVDKFPLSKDRALFIEVYEKNGGRHLYLKAKRSDIERAHIINPK